MGSATFHLLQGLGQSKLECVLLMGASGLGFRVEGLGIAEGDRNNISQKQAMIREALSPADTKPLGNTSKMAPHFCSAAEVPSWESVR